MQILVQFIPSRFLTLAKSLSRRHIKILLKFVENLISDLFPFDHSPIALYSWKKKTFIKFLFQQPADLNGRGLSYSIILFFFHYPIFYKLFYGQTINLLSQGFLISRKFLFCIYCIILKFNSEPLQPLLQKVKLDLPGYS